MNRLETFVASLTLAAIAATSSAEITIPDGAYFFNGIRKERVVGRSSFKLANHITYHFTGQGGGHYGLGSARRWVDWNNELGFDILRVLLETEGWNSDCEPAELSNDGKPDNCMFGSEPTDQGFWDVEALRHGGRPTDMHGVGKSTLRWFFATSQETGMAFELVIIATLKHNDISVGQQTHVIRQTMHEAREFQSEFPQANVLMSGINEWNAHSEWTLAEVNMLAVRNDRCKHPDGRTAVRLACPPGFEPEQWAGGSLPR